MNPTKAAALSKMFLLGSCMQVDNGKLYKILWLLEFGHVGQTWWAQLQLCLDYNRWSNWVTPVMLNGSDPPHRLEPWTPGPVHHTLHATWRHLTRHQSPGRWIHGDTSLNWAPMEPGNLLQHFDFFISVPSCSWPLHQHQSLWVLVLPPGAMCHLWRGSGLVPFCLEMVLVAYRCSDYKVSTSKHESGYTPLLVESQKQNPLQVLQYDTFCQQTWSGFQVVHPSCRIYICMITTSVLSKPNPSPKPDLLALHK